MKTIKELDLANFKEWVSISDKVKDVITKFNGKVLNVKLSKALNEIDCNFYFHVEVSYNSLKIYTYAKNRYILTEPDKNGVRGTIYTDYDKDFFCYDAINVQGDRILLSSDNRMLAENINKCIDKNVDYLKERINGIENFNIQDAKEKKEELLRQIEKFNNSIPSYYSNTKIKIQR